MDIDNPEGIHVTVKERLFKGAGAQAFSQIARIFIRLAEVPLLLNFWGPNLYGEWLMVAAIPMYLVMADVGFTGTASREMAMRVGADDRSGALSVFQSTWLLVLVASVACVLMIGLAVTAIPLGSWLHLDAIQGNSLTWVVLILMAHVVVSFQTGLLYGGYCSEGRYGIGVSLLTTTQLLEFAGLALAVMLGGGPVMAAGGFLAGRIVGFMLLRIVLVGIAPWLHFGWKSADREQVLRLVRPALASMAFPIGNALNIQGMRLVVGIALGPVAVTVFTTLRTLSRVGFQLVQSVSNMIEPELGLAFGKGDMTLFRQIIRRSCQVAWWSALAACLILLLAGEKLLGVWTRGQISMNWLLYVWLLLATIINALWSTMLMAAYATNRHGWIALVYAFIYGAGALSLAYVGAHAAGLPGVGVAVVLAEVGMAAYVVPAALRLSGDTWVPWLRTVILPPWFFLRRLRYGRVSGQR